MIVLGAPFSDVVAAIKTSGHIRDIITIEPIGLLEQVILCKLGTRAKGLIPIIGTKLPSAQLASLDPRKIKEFIRRPFL